MSENSGIRKKLDINGIMFRTWLLLVLFAFGIVLALWGLQMLSLTPYYRSVKVNTVQNITRDINQKIMESEDFASDIVEVTYNNNLCLSVYNHQKKKLTSVNSLGLGCRITPEAEFDEAAFLDEVDHSANSEVSHYVTDERFNNESLIYGSKINSEIGSYYLVINANVEPVDSTVFIMQNQFIMIGIAVLIVATLISYLLSRLYSSPISKMTSGARKLSAGDYHVEFDDKSFTEIKELNDTLSYASHELAKTEEIRTELLANVSHDIKTPLTTIKAYAEMIEDISGDNKKKRNEHLEIIISETNHLNKLVNDMMVLTKVQSGNLTLNCTDFDLVPLSEEIIDVLIGSANNLNVKIEKDFPANAIIHADRTMIGQVIYNFLNNAIKHCGADNKVLVRITPENENWKLEVIDHGIGISEEEVPYIWERYYKANKTYHRNQEGSGLGLAISKGYLELHKFAYGVKTKVNEGSTFYFIADSEPNEATNV
ncbi:MAG: HAMP domain-containing histidine kinase [Erysipelotrichaceae bacterium]|nr:HAMP domain-containing histidine kinase [Erysipelotrichaceae bacterium]